jgi:acyl-CoA hydrolase
MQDLETQIARAETRIFKAVFPNTTNHYDTLFGGATLMLMDEVAFITATRFSRLKMVTVSSDRVDFTHPIPGGTLVELIGNVVRVGTTSLQVRVELYVEQMYSDERLLAVTGSFTFVAVDEHRQPTPLRPVAVGSEPVEQ